MTNPFRSQKISVVTGAEGAREFLEKYPEYSFCFYLAHKSPKDWARSTSRVYMNQIFGDLIYLPVDVAKGDSSGIEAVLKLTQTESRILAVNITQPHKSNVALGKYVTAEGNIDTVFKKGDRLVGFDLNAPAFVGWLQDEIGLLTGKTVVLIGIGGVGKPIAEFLASCKLKRLVLISPSSRQELAEQLDKKVPTEYHQTLQSAELPEDELIVINAAGKEGAADNPSLSKVLDERTGIFVDIRPHLDIPIVKEAQRKGWQAFTGHGMNARNDYVIVERLASVLHQKAPDFKEFKRLVAEAS